MKCFTTIVAMTLVTCGMTTLITLVLATCAYPEMAAAARPTVVDVQPISPDPSAEGVTRNGAVANDHQ